MQCPWLENMMSIETDGWTRPCCLETDNAARISKISDGILKSFNHQKLIQLRQDLTHGFNENTQYACKRCESLESRNQQSMRTTTPTYSGSRELKVLQFKMSNKCQLTCAHCGPDRSSGWRKILNIKPHVIDAFEVTTDFLDELKLLLPQLEVLKFTGGEPFLDPNHWKILEALQAADRSHCRLEYITNGLVRPKHNLWEGWKDITCSVSADGYKDSFEWFRRGASWEELVDGVEDLKTRSSVNINFAVTPYTIQDYHNAKDFWRCDILSYPVVYPNHASLLNFPRSLITSIDNYNTIPFYDSTTTDSDNVGIYKLWAFQWDKQWNTEGWANRLFRWML